MEIKDPAVSGVDSARQDSNAEGEEDQVITGRPRKPAAVKLAEGNRSKRPINERELLEGPEIPDCPEWLDEEGRAAWERITPVLYDLGVIRLADETALASMCQAISILKGARAQLDAMPADKRYLFKTANRIVQNPLIAICTRQAEVIHRIAAEFGMTPSSRARLLSDDNSVVVPPQTLEEILAERTSASAGDDRFAEPVN